MFVKITRKQIHEKCFVVLVCLVMFGSLSHQAVLCSASNGHIEIESAFHERCDASAHSQPADQKQLSHQLDHVEDKHCEPCVDIPISSILAKISRVPKRLNSTFSAPAANVVVPAEKFNISAHNSASGPFDAASYFTPLGTVILLI